jgi:hypothetical protein
MLGLARVRALPQMGPCPVGPALTPGGLALHLYGRQARHADPRASSGLAPVLAVEVAAERPPIPKDLQRLIVRRMPQENPTWGEERIANELRLKLGLRVSRALGRYLRPLSPRRGGSQSRWATFVRNHAHAIVACDFFTTVNGRFPGPVHLRRPRGRHASDRSLERHHASDGAVDDPAVPRGYHPRDVPCLAKLEPGSGTHS